MSSKDLFMKNTFKRKEWTSPQTGAVFLVCEPNAKQLVDIIKIAQSGKGELEVSEVLIRYVWGNLIRDPDTGRMAFLPSDVDGLFEAKSLDELAGPLNLVMEMVGLNVPDEVHVKN